MRRRLLLGGLLGAMLALAVVVLRPSAPEGPASAGDAATLREGDGGHGGENELAELTEPAEVQIARQLSGSEPGIVPGRFFRAAQHQAAVLADRTAALAPAVAGAAWQLVGPKNVGGRVLEVVVDPTRPDTVYAAAATGGVWKSTDAGQTFAPAWPDDQTQAVGALAITSTGTLFAGTGEAGPGGGSITYGGDGVYRSTDGGATWERVGLPETSRIGRIVVDPRDERRIFVAGTGPLYRRGGGRGLYLSTDGGTSWRRVLAGENDTTGAVDLAIDPRDSRTVYAALWDNFRERDRRSYEGLGSGLYKSTDGGETWARIGTPYFGPRPDLGRIGVAVAPDGTVYANASGASGTYSGLYASHDGGLTWATGAPPPVPLDSYYVYGWWFGRVWVDPQDSRHVYQAGLQLLESRDGGRSWANAPGSYHVDQHGLAWDPKVAGRVYLANDGGVYRSDDNGGSWAFAKELPIGQINGFDVSQQDPTRMVVGLQDNNSQRNWRTRTDPGGERWNSYLGGDGQRVLIAPDNKQVVYGCYQYGECVVSTNGASNTTSFSDQVVSTRKNWFTPIEFAPEDSSTIFTGGEIISRGVANASDFQPISPDLTNGPGRETNPLFRNYGTVTTIAPAARVAGRPGRTIYAGTDDGNLWYTHDDSDLGAWTKVSDPKLPKAWITRVEVDPRDENTAYVTYSGFRQDDNAKYVFRTTDGGRTWSDIASGSDLPDAPVNDVNVIGDAVVVASDVGVFFRRPTDASWLRLGTGLPLAPAYELRYVPATKELFVATFGRSAWKIDASVLTQ